MKKIFTLISGTFFLTSIASAQLLLTEDFNYSGLLTSNGWTQTALEAGDPIQTTTPGLTFPGYPNSGIGNAAAMTGTLQDVSRGFAKQTAGGTNIWMSAMVNVTEATNISGNGVNFLHLGDRDDAAPSTFNNFAGRIYVKANATGVSFGASQTSSSFYGTGIFARNTTYLLVLKLTINAGGITAGPSDLKLWVFSSGTPSTEADLGTPEIDNPAAITPALEIDAVALRQASGLPDVIVDGIRIANSYQQISLPLNLTSFKAALTERSVNLNWTSANEQNVRNFSVERSSNGREFNAIGTVDAANRTVGTYSFSDNAPLAGVSYYRLKMIDKDGVFKYSTTIAINNRKTVSAEVFPNPAFNSLNVSHPKTGKSASVKIINTEGRVVKNYMLSNGGMQTNLSISELAKGNYTLVFENDGEKSSTHFIKQ
jgi:hypothetical protein